MPVTGRLLCPVCQELLMPVDRDGVEIDYCPQCRGVWLDRGELEKIIERYAQGAARPSGIHPRYDYHPHEHEKYEDRHRYRKRKKLKSFLEDLFDFD